MFPFTPKLSKDGKTELQEQFHSPGISNLIHINAKKQTKPPRFNLIILILHHYDVDDDVTWMFS